jgi:hypothetical protein
VDPTYSPATQEAAAQFAAVWLNKSGKTAAQWRAGLTELVTKAEAADLAYADPDSVPVGAKVGEPIPVAADGDLWRAGVPVVTVAAAPKPVGVLSLALVRSGGRWLVAEIDWQGAR